jgi:hypothetical protein
MFAAQAPSAPPMSKYDDIARMRNPRTGEQVTTAYPNPMGEEDSGGEEEEADGLVKAYNEQSEEIQELRAEWTRMRKEIEEMNKVLKQN